MIAITGATGQLGRSTLKALLDQQFPAEQLVALARDVGKAADLAALGIEVRAFDYSRPATLAEALQGVEKLLLISSNELGQRAAQHRAVIEAASHAGVKLLAYTSVLRADTSPLGLAEEHRQTEAALQASDVPYVVLRNGWYNENHAAGVPVALQHGALLGSAGEGRIASAARADYAEAAARVLLAQGQAGKVYELAGDASYDLEELAALITDMSGQLVTYQDLPEADYQAVLEQAGLPLAIANLLADSDAAAAQGALADDGGVLRWLLGRSTTPMAVTVAAVLEAR